MRASTFGGGSACTPAKKLRMDSSAFWQLPSTFTCCFTLPRARAPGHRRRTAAHHAGFLGLGAAVRGCSRRTHDDPALDAVAEAVRLSMTGAKKRFNPFNIHYQFQLLEETKKGRGGHQPGSLRSLGGCVKRWSSSSMAPKSPLCRMHRPTAWFRALPGPRPTPHTTLTSHLSGPLPAHFGDGPGGWLKYFLTPWSTRDPWTRHWAGRTDRQPDRPPASHVAPDLRRQSQS